MRAFRIKDRFYGWFCHPEGGFCPKDLGFEKSRTKSRSFAPLRMTNKGKPKTGGLWLCHSVQRRNLGFEGV